ncbi:hypothetical protein [Thermococcus nautili]|uniref:Putative VapB component of the VapBC toxin-antitoxin system n=1 Tax=Thermococcus nautili TaxID=195522 RepID=U3RLP4_9EURY|nr:hypothetical protein [Thermococcus nautili]AGX15345.1 Putative VapB component of the VapBC toxin-antitoxin system [Thermococcus nautili]AHL23872.1 hypothetical protein BD01_2285 [Thermococcus nautili]
MRVRVRVYGGSIPERVLARELKRALEIKKTASELYELLSEEELDEIKREVSKKRVSFRDFGDID